MMDFIEYVVAEFKHGRLSKADVLDLLKQFSRQASASAPGRERVLHPLVQRNVSDLTRQCYGSTFDGSECFLDDHQVAVGDEAPVKMLPAVAYLEMVRAAVVDALPDLDAEAAVQLDDVVWLRPIVAAPRAEVMIVLSSGAADTDVDAQTIVFEVCDASALDAADDAADDDAKRVCCRGVARIKRADRPARLDIEALKARMQAGRLDAQAIYGAYRTMGLRFGPAHQAIECVYRGRREVLAQLALPDAVGVTLGDFRLHPSLLDGALQASIGLLDSLEALPREPTLPFVLDSLQVFAPCTPRMVAWIRHAGGDIDIANDARADVTVDSRLDVDLCDDAGEVCVTLRGFVSRPLAQGAGATPGAAARGLIVARPVWRATPQEAIRSHRADGEGETAHLVLLGALSRVPLDALQVALPVALCRALPTEGATVADRYTAAALACFEALRAWCAERPKDSAFVHVIAADAGEARLLAGLSGLLQSAARECAGLAAQVMLVDADIDTVKLAAHLSEAVRQGLPAPAIVRYLGDTREVLEWEALAADSDDAPAVFNERGVYLITGGLGGLGTLFAREILARTSGSHVVLTGRAAPSDDIEAKLRALAPDAATRERVTYERMNLLDLDSVRYTIEQTVARHGRLHGILHAAGIIRDGLLAHKSSDTFASVLAPKVHGTVNLDLATAPLDLDLFVLFSSGAAAIGNAGQADYACANGFLDEFARYRDGLVAAGRRRGRTLAIDWPLWADGGMRMPPRTFEALREASGMLPLRTRAGTIAFARSVASPHARTLVVEGELARIRHVLFGEPIVHGETTQAQAVDEAAAPRSEPALAAGLDAGALAEPTRDYLRKQFAELFRMPHHKIDTRAPLEKYGIDSILAMDLTSQLEKTFGPLSKTLFFEHQSIEELTAYFVGKHQEKLAVLFGHAPTSQIRRTAGAVDAEQPIVPPSVSRLPARAPTRMRTPGRATLGFPSARLLDDEPIAIVGLSGRYPQACDLDAYWRNLSEGKDCITEVPPERWDWRDYYSTDRTREGAHYSKWGGFIEGVDEFDPLFFNIPPVDAELIDPQERLFLQHAWMAIEDAGYTRASLQMPHDDDLPGQVGVYVGVMYGEYQLFGAEASAHGHRIGVPVSYASIANRVSYVLNLHGPSLTLDSMCSSSLTAIHLACQDLRSGRTSLAIAGGVNVSIHPNKYLILSAGQYISSDGHCQSFGEGGDGYIPGEGVGVVVLKRLSDAERDGNPIHGLLRASALNHGGKTNGYSVPNPKAQASVIRQALKSAGVDPRHVSYIEAHGTGTKLGDPIEIAALTEVFHGLADRDVATGADLDTRHVCAIGSVKSNIGHCESAAGIAGLTKVLLQMRHRQIAPSLHSAVLNPHIDFDATPFFVNQTLRGWDAPVVGGRALPRIAGVSSFGAGGSNAHLIVEEYVPAPPASPAPPMQPEAGRTPVIVPLSARTEPQLRQKALDLLAFLERPAGQGDRARDLTALAYTLQVGREAMDSRIAFLTDSLDALLVALRAYCNGERNIEGCFDAPDAQARDELAALSHDEDMIATVDKWIARGKLTRLAELWVKGFAFDWRKLYRGRMPRLQSLPTYPFAKQHYWIARRASLIGARADRSPGRDLHPLLHANASDLFRQRYTARFAGDEAFLADHRIDLDGAGARKVLPAAAYLEMVRAAVDLAMPVGTKPAAWDVRDVVWLAPLVVDVPVSISVELTPSAEGRIDFAVSSSADGDARTEHCRGYAWPLRGAGAGIDDNLGSRVPALDLAGLRARMTANARDANEVYEAFASMGIHYGSSFRTVRTLACGVDEVLVELAAPISSGAGMRLSPGLFDGALQASLGLLGDWTCLPDVPAMPFALDSLVVFDECPPRMFAWVRRAADAPDRPSGRGIAKLDVDLCDAEGRVRVRATGITSRAWPERTRQPAALIAQPVWENVAAEAMAASREGAMRRHVLLCALSHVDRVKLAERLPGATVECLPSPDAAANDAERYRVAALACFAKLRALSADGAKEPVLYQLAIGSEDDALLAGLSGLLETARSEQPHLRVQLVLTDSTTDGDTLAAQLERARVLTRERVLRFAQGKSEGEPEVEGAPCVQRWRTERVGDTPPLAFREHGVYLITGGLGGLGQLFSREILSRTRGATVVLTGRAELDDTRRAQLHALAESLAIEAGRLVYRRVDLAREADVAALIASIVDEFGALDGVLHSAGMIADSLIVNKTEADFAEVLAPKVAGTLHLDHATRHIDLAFFVMFSSVAAVFGNAGQADYACANGFMDRFAERRNQRVAAGERRGRTLSIGWPLWQDGGMHLDADALTRLAEVSGMRPMPTETGMRAFAQALASEAAHAIVMAGDVERLRRVLNTYGDEQVQVERMRQAEPTLTPLAPDAARDTLREQARHFVAGEFATLLKLEERDIDSHAPLEKYGLDSVLAMKFTQHLERSFGTLSKTLLFEYQTLAALAHYLTDAFPQIVRERAGGAPAGARHRIEVLPTPQALGATSWPLHRLAMPNAMHAIAHDAAVAIVGVAGRYPKADDLRMFWRNLRDGVDCITEVPPQRWDHARWFDARRNQPGKTYSRWGGFLNGVDEFDPLFFGISPREAELMDPQERLFLETAWETFEDAGYAKQDLAGQRVGVYVGAMWGQYELYGVHAAQAGVPSSSFASIANRVSYFFDFHGPSLALDSMCSSSLSALHLAVEAVRAGTIDVALAGGVNVTAHPSKYLSLSQGGFASSDGRCRSFGAGGDGYVPGEGVGAVLLKPLSRALADGDQIYAIVKASGLNHGGKTNGYTVPNPVAQGELIHDTLVKAGVSPGEIDYVETHGTGTALGDPIEITGLARAFAQAAGTTPLARAACAIGSVKSNIGHLESAAGIAAVTKVLLQFRHRQIVPSLHAEPPNPHVDFDATPFHVQTTLADWPRHAGRPARAAVSSFGAGGANAHLILEAFEDGRREPSAGSRSEAFVLSARDRASLRAYAREMLAFVADVGASLPTWADMAYTSQVGRTPMPIRLVVIAADADTFCEKLARWLDRVVDDGPALPDVYEGSARDARTEASALIDGEAGTAFLRVALQQRDLAKLAKLWVAGVEIEWARLHEAGRVRRVSLPTYPFAKERYWIAAAPTGPAAPDAQAFAASLAQPVPVDPPQLMHYGSVWHAAELPPYAGDAPIAGPVLLVDADDAFAKAFARAAGDGPIVAVSGLAYQELGPDHIVFDPSIDTDVDRLITALRERASRPRVIVHCMRPCADGETEQQLTRGVFTLHALCQAWLRDKDDTQHDVRIVSLRMSDDSHAPLHEATSGYLRSLAREVPRFAGKTLTLTASMTLDDAARCVCDELRDVSWRDGDGEVRYVAHADQGGTVGRQRQVSRIERIDDSTMADTPLSGSPYLGAAIRHGGVYLVTGGLGGIGYALSEHLARTCRARLVLAGRSPLDAEIERKLTQLHGHGGDAIYVQADLANLAQTQALIASAKRHFGRLDGVIHSAGVLRDAFALHKTRADMRAVFAAKIAGTVHLDLVTRDEPLDLFVLFSSLSGVAGNAGQTDYAYANRFLDAFAAQRAAQVCAGARRGKTLSISWPLWEAGGMGVAAADVELLHARTGLHPLPTPLGLQSWERCVAGDRVHTVVLYGEPSRVDALSGRGAGAGAGAAAPWHAVDPERAAATVSDAALEEAAMAYLKRLVSEQIKLPVERIDEQERFDTFGIDSIAVNQLNAALERDLGALPKTLFYEYPSIGELAVYLLGHTRPGLTRMLAPVADVRGRAAERATAEANEKIAIIGVHGRFPGSDDLDAFWENLRAGRDLIREVPADRWDASASFDPDPDQAEHGRIYSRWGGFLDDVDAFDAAFFGITPDDATLIDPQERLFLQSVWHAFEDAGYTREALKRRHPKGRSADVGVFCGVTTHSYQMLAPDEWQRGNLVAPASMPWSIANRVSYVFDFQGPSMPVDTACSSSLVAIHLAAESLRRGECQVAVAGGVNLYLHPSKYYSLCRRRMLARGPQCRSFGAGDDGFVPGEGVGTVVLKPLSRALADGDRIHGVIAASACEHGGRANGYSAPNPNAQAQLIERALRSAGLPPDAIGYVEGHGTGTQLGDSLEVASLNQAFRGGTSRTRYCPLGSVKSNIGHAESAAGMGSVAKVLLQFRHRQLAPTLHARDVNPNIDFAQSPFYLQHDLADWPPPADDAPRRALLNAFGAGGVNACVILEEHRERASARNAETASAKAQLIVLSARSDARLREYAARLHHRLLVDPDMALDALAYTLQTGRETMEERLAIVASDRSALVAELALAGAGTPSPVALRGHVEPHRRKKSLPHDERARLRALHASGDWRAIAQCWIEGQDLDWDDFATNPRPVRVSLPGYPFDDTRYRVSDTPPRTPSATDTVALVPARLHPLVGANASTLQEVSFSSRLSPDAWYARDHRVDRTPLFPGAGFIEIACVAGALAGERTVRALEDVVWHRPLSLAAGGQLVKTLLKASGDSADFVAVSFDSDNERVVHAEGRVLYEVRGTRARDDGSHAADRVSIDALRAGAATTLSGEHCYDMLGRFGLHYGPSFRTIRKLHVGDGFALSELRLADACCAQFEQYVWHPTLIDGALQTVLGFVSGSGPVVPHVPFALGGVERIRPLVPLCYAYARPCDATPGAPGAVRQFDIQLLDSRGEVLVALKRLYVRARSSDVAQAEYGQASHAGGGVASVPMANMTKRDGV